MLAELGSDAARGLTTEEALLRAASTGANEIAAEPPIPAWRRFLAQFRNVLIVLLLIAGAISLALWFHERETTLPYDALVIFAIVLFNGILGYVQESRAERSVAALRAMAAADASVVRDGQPKRVPAAELVPGDIIVIESGDTIAADGRLIESVALQTAEASLTGESLPVAEDTDAAGRRRGIGDRTTCVFSGTAASYGRGRAVVTSTGMEPRWAGSPACWAGRGRSDAAAAGAGPHRQAAGPRGRGHCGGHGRDDHPGPRDPRDRGACRRADPGRGAGGGGGAGRSAGRRDGGAGAGRQRMAVRNAHRPQAAGRGNARLGHVIASDKTGTLTKNEMTVRADRDGRRASGREWHGYDAGRRLPPR